MLGLGLVVVWLYWESNLPREQWFVDRHGEIQDVSVDTGKTPYGQRTEQLILNSSSGLQVKARLIRDEKCSEPLPVFIVLGGHRTGSDAVDLFGKVGENAIVGIDYPYDGPHKIRGVLQTLEAIPKVRNAFLDTVPAVSLVIDWLEQQSWVDSKKIIIIGGSLGVPFAATSAARDDRITGVILVHGAKDNRLWIEAQLARRIETKWLYYPVSTILHWMAYGSVHDTGKNVAAIAPRPTLIIGARNDERTPSGQTELLFEHTKEPKRLRFTNGNHIQPNRPQVIADLLKIAAEEMPFLTDGKY